MSRLQLRFTQAVLRCLYAYFHNLPQEDLPYIKIPLHTVIKVTPKAYGCDEERFKVPIEAVDTHRPKPKRIAEKDGKFAAASPEGIADLSKSPPRTFFVDDLTK
jgi:6-phosphofructo-2-kinase/fructose-2,6-biphosphatase 2